jgi:hypothetical protein
MRMSANGHAQSGLLPIQACYYKTIQSSNLSIQAHLDHSLPNDMCTMARTHNIWGKNDDEGGKASIT